MPLSKSSVTEVSGQWKHVWTAYCAVFLVGVLTVLCMVAPSSLSPPSFLQNFPRLHLQASIRDQPDVLFEQPVIAMTGQNKQFLRSWRLPRPARAQQSTQSMKTLQSMQPAKARISRSLHVAMAQQSTEPLAATAPQAASGRIDDRSISDMIATSRIDDYVAAAKAVGALNAPGTAGASPAQTVRALYDAFNERNATKTAALLADDCVYEDLLLGEATVCRGRGAFESALNFHPAFLGDTLTRKLPSTWKTRIPSVNLVVDSVAEDPVRGTVGVEWHVGIQRLEEDPSLGLLRATSVPFPLGRGLSHATIDLATGKIKRVVDIAEAPWRVVGLLVTPFIEFGSALAWVTQNVGSTKFSGKDSNKSPITALSYPETKSNTPK